MISPPHPPSSHVAAAPCRLLVCSATNSCFCGPFISCMAIPLSFSFSFFEKKHLTQTQLVHTIITQLLSFWRCLLSLPPRSLYYFQRFFIHHLRLLILINSSICCRIIYHETDHSKHTRNFMSCYNKKTSVWHSRNNNKLIAKIQKARKNGKK